MAGVQKLSLNNLNTNIKNAYIVGIIIAKKTPHTLRFKSKNGESRAVTTFTLRDSDIDTINVDIWGTQDFVTTFYERFLIGDVVEIFSPKICTKCQETYKPQVTSPFYLTLNEGQSNVSKVSGETCVIYRPLLHIPTKPCAGYCDISEVLKLKEQKNEPYVDLLVVVKSVKPGKRITTRAGTDMTVRSVEILDNSSPASLRLDMYDIDTINRAEEWRPLESVLFIADARVSWREFAVHVLVSSRTVITHQPHTPEAEALRLYICNQGDMRGGETAAWAAWSGERASSATVSLIRDRLKYGVPFCAALHALLTHLDLDDLIIEGNSEEVRVRFADHTGELNARLPVDVLEEAFGYNVDQLKCMSEDDRNATRWKYLLEQCSAKLAVSPPRIIVLTLRRASPADPVPLY